MHTLGFLFVLMGVLKLPLSVVYPVLFTSPLMLLVMSHFFLNENIYSRDDSIIILRTLLNKSKKILILSMEYEKNNKKKRKSRFLK